MINRLLSIAPMMDWTDRHYRFFIRCISKHILLYTEMVTTGAIIHGDRDYLLGYAPCEHPLAVQLGGSNASELAQCAQICADYGYDEINLNVGCPSDRVQSGRFGACLMLEPQLVADCVAAMQDAVSIPVTVKTRLGVDEQDSYDDLHHFIQTVADTGCRVFIIHARKAWLQGLSPKENREIPPLKYEFVHWLKNDFPACEIIINGGLTDLEQAEQQHMHLDGVMIGREAYHNPFIFADIDAAFYGDTHVIPTREAVVEQMIPYIDAQMREGVRLNAITRHMLGLYHGVAGARHWRRTLSENSHKADATTALLRQAIPCDV